MKFNVGCANSSRSKCRYTKCGEKIEKGVLRFGKTSPSPFNEDGELTQWFHIACAFDQMRNSKRAIRPKTLEEVEGFDELEDKNKDEVTNLFNSLPDESEPKPKKGASKKKAAAKVESEDEQGAENGDSRKPEKRSSSPDNDDEATGAKKSPRKKKRTVEAKDKEAESTEDEDVKPKGKGKAKPVVKAVEALAAKPKKPVAKGKGKKAKEEEVIEEQPDIQDELTPEALETPPAANGKAEDAAPNVASDEDLMKGEVIASKASPVKRQAPKRGGKAKAAEQGPETGDQKEKPEAAKPKNARKAKAPQEGKGEEKPVAKKVEPKVRAARKPIVKKTTMAASDSE